MTCSSPRKESRTRAQLKITRSNQFPQIGATGTGTDGRTYQGFPANSKFATYAADATFQLDLFGQLRRQAESARAQVLASEFAMQSRQ